MRKEEEEFLEEIKKEIKDDNSTEEKNYSGPIKIIISMFLIFMIILWIVPGYLIKTEPEPRKIEKIEFNIETIPEPYQSFEEIIYDNITTTIRNTAITITTQSCKEYSRLCYAKALYYYVRDNIKYINDPEGRDYLQRPQQTLLGAGDCEDQAILLNSLMLATGIRSRIVLIPGHAFIEININEAPKKYKEDNGWISLDTTCSSCNFGKLPISSDNKNRRYIE
jgi:hypothetical protein